MDYETLLNMVRTYFSDTSRSPEQTRNGLDNLVGEIEMMIDSLPDDDGGES